MRFDNSPECMKSELDLFSVPPTQSSLENGVWCSKEASEGYKSSTATVNFNIPANADHYLDFSENFLHLKCLIRKKNLENTLATKNFEATDKIGPVNGFLHFLFSQVEVKINGTSVENSNKMYPYRAYFDIISRHDIDTQMTQLNNEMFIPDQAGYFENYDLEDEPLVYKLDNDYLNNKIVNRTGGTKKTNEGYINRRNRFLTASADGEIELCGKLHINLASTPKYMLNNVSVEIILTRSDPQFCLMGVSGDYSVYISEAVFRYRKIKYSDRVAIGHLAGLERMNAQYPYKEVKMNSVSIPSGSESLTITNIHNGKAPNFMLMGFVSTSAFSGDYARNPVFFQPFGLKSLLVKIGGENIPYNEDLKFNYNAKQYAQAYNTLFQKAFAARNITFDDYPKGTAIYMFDFTPDLCSLNHFNVTKHGEISVTCNFQKTQENIHAIFYLEFDNILEISKLRVAIPNPN